MQLSLVYNGGTKSLNVKACTEKLTGTGLVKMYLFRYLVSSTLFIYVVSLLPQEMGYLLFGVICFFF